MTATKLSIANGALRLLKEGKLTSAELTNGSREPARLFNDIWDDGGLNHCLEAGQWRSAKRTLLITGVETDEDFGGYAYAFEKPEDFVRTCGVWSDNRQFVPLNDYRDENGFWYAELDHIYVAYVSNDALFGLDYSLWPPSFNEFVQAHFAAKMAGPLTSQGGEMLVYRERALRKALSIDGMSDPTRKLPNGGWVTSRSAGPRKER